MSDHGLFSSYKGHQERQPGKIRGAFSRMYRTLDGWMLNRTLASPAQGLHHHSELGLSIFLHFVLCGILQNLDLLLKTDWTAICLLCC